MRTLLASALLLLAGVGHAQIVTVNEQLSTSSNTFLVDVNSPRLDVGTASYTGSVPGTVLFVGSNVVVGTGTGASSQVVIYATGTIMLKGVSIGAGGTGAASTMTITWQHDDLRPDGVTNVFALSNTPSSTAAVTCVLDGLMLGSTSFHFAMPNQVTVTTAPAASSPEFFCQYTINTSTLPAAFILTATQTVSGSNSFVGSSTFTQVYMGATSTMNAAGAWSTWVPIFTGFSVSPTVTYARYIKIGKMVTIAIKAYTGSTSNSTGMTFSLPFPAANTDSQATPVMVVDSSSFLTGVIQTNANSAVVSVFNANFSNFTATGNKGVLAVFTYETN